MGTCQRVKKSTVDVGELLTEETEIVSAESECPWQVGIHSENYRDMGLFGIRYS